MDKWSKELPEEILNLIFSQFSLVEIIRVGFVSKSWLSISRKISKCPQLPWLMMLSDPTSENHKEEARPCFSLSNNTTFTIKLPETKRCCGYFNNSGGCWMTVDEKLGIQLFHPWQGIELQLPHSSSFPYMNIRKAAMSDDGTTVVVIYDSQSLAFCKIRDKVWIDIKPPKRTQSRYCQLKSYQDVIYQKGKFYTLGNCGILGVCHIDSGTPYVETLRVEVLPRYFGCPYLVPDSGSKSIFFVYLHHFEDDQQEGPLGTWEFQVFKIGLEATGKYSTDSVRVESLSDRIMFLSQKSSMVVRSSEFPRLVGNCIYFTDECLRQDGSPVLGVYNMEDGSVKQLFQLGASPIFTTPVWITPPVME